MSSPERATPPSLRRVDLVSLPIAATTLTLRSSLPLNPEAVCAARRQPLTAVPREFQASFGLAAAAALCDRSSPASVDTVYVLGGRANSGVSFAAASAAAVAAAAAAAAPWGLPCRSGRAE